MSFVSSKGNILCWLVNIELYKIFAIINRAIKGLHCILAWIDCDIFYIHNKTKHCNIVSIFSEIYCPIFQQPSYGLGVVICDCLRTLPVLSTQHCQNDSFSRVSTWWRLDIKQLWRDDMKTFPADTCLLLGETTGERWIALDKGPVMRGFVVLCVISVEKLLNKQLVCRYLRPHGANVTSLSWKPRQKDHLLNVNT